MHALLQKWIFAGTNTNNPEQFNSIKICNMITLTAAVIILLQVPLLLINSNPQTVAQLSIIFVHVLGLIFIPQANIKGMYRLGRLSLVLIFTSYISVSSINYEFHTQVHMFFLIGIFVVPFLHFDLEQKEVLSMMIFFFLLYMLWEIKLVSATLNSLDDYFSMVSESDRISFALSCFFVGFFLYTTLKSGWLRIKNEQQRSENLLLNILPQSIASRLSQQEKPIADHFENVTILFADIEDFSRLSQQMSPASLVSVLNDLFSRFDKLCEQFQLEKIKTVGDQYMAVSGLPVKNEQHALLACHCAIKMQEEFTSWSTAHNLDTSLRVGINSGPVVAGVIGIHKFTYDLWGEAVNLASRMESHGSSGKIQVSESTYELVQGAFMFDYRDAIEVKGMGYQNVYWLNEPYNL